MSTQERPLLQSGTFIDDEALLVRIEVARCARSDGVFGIGGLVGLWGGDEAQAQVARLRCAMEHGSYQLPPYGLAAAIFPSLGERPGWSGYHDLALAVGTLLASGQLPYHPCLKSALLLGYLAPDGSVHQVRGVLPMVRQARAQRLTSVFVPASSADEAALVEGIEVYPVQTLAQLVRHLLGTEAIKPFQHSRLASSNGTSPSSSAQAVDMAMIRGQLIVRRALEIAAGGGHNVLLIGPPGAGKSLLAHAFPSILPPLSAEECLEVTAIYSLAGMLPEAARPLIGERPFRAPHSSIGERDVLGEDGCVHRSECLLAHHGVLLLDDLSQYKTRTLWALRSALRQRQIRRLHHSFPFRAITIAAMHPCPCGYYTDPVRECTCTAEQITRHLRRVQLTMQGCFDLILDVPSVSAEQLLDTRPAESSSAIAERVARARFRQMQRLGEGKLNAHLDAADLFASLAGAFAVDVPARSLLKAAINQLYFTAETFHRTLKVARTCADLAEQEQITVAHIAEAISYARWGGRA